MKKVNWDRLEELQEDELPEGVEAICENCGAPCEYDSKVCLCEKCQAEEQRRDEKRGLHPEHEDPAN